jgi:hypothetical protein
MTRPGEFLAFYGDNTSGRGSHRNCIEALKTIQKIGLAYGIKLGTIKVLICFSGAQDNSALKRQHYLDLGVKTEDIITHPDDIPPPISRLRRERSLADRPSPCTAGRKIQLPIARYSTWSRRIHLEISQRQVLWSIRSMEAGYQVQGHPVGLAHVQYVLIQIHQPYVQADPDCIYYVARFHFRRHPAQRNQRDSIQ